MRSRSAATADTLIVAPRIYLTGNESISGWIAVKGGQVIGAGEHSPPQSDAVYEFDDQVVIPGLVDIHVHFRDPDQTHKETFRTGSLAAAFGGVTTVGDMPNDLLRTSDPKNLETKILALRGRSWVDYALHAEMPDEPQAVESLARLGVSLFKWYLGYADHDHMFEHQGLLDSAGVVADLGMTIGVHAEDATWRAELSKALMARGRDGLRAHGESRPPFVEALGIAQALLVGRHVGCAIHLHHVSSELGVATSIALRDSVHPNTTIETCPHYLHLDESSVGHLGHRGKVNPPLRTAADRNFLWTMVESGQINCIASDHAPHPQSDENSESIWGSSAGFVGVETMLPLLIDHCITGELGLEDLVQLSSTQPAQIAGLANKGRLEPGSDADMVSIDLKASATPVHAENLHSRSKNSPYLNAHFRGAIDTVFLRGRVLIRNDRVVGTPEGRFVARTPSERLKK